MNTYTSSGVEWAFSRFLTNYSSKPGKCVYLIIALSGSNRREQRGGLAAASPRKEY